MNSTYIRRKTRTARRTVNKLQCDVHRSLVHWTATYFAVRSLKKAYQGTTTTFGTVNGSVQYCVTRGGKQVRVALPAQVANLWAEVCAALGAELLGIPTVIDAQKGRATIRVWDKTWKVGKVHG